MNEYSILHLLEGNRKKKFIETKKRTIKKITKIKKKNRKKFKIRK